MNWQNIYYRWQSYKIIKRYKIWYDTRVKRLCVSCLHEKAWLIAPNIMIDIKKKRQEMHGIFCRFFLDDFYKDYHSACGDVGYEKQYWKKWKKMKKMKKVLDKQKERWYYKPRCWGNALKQRLSRRSLKRLPVRQQKRKIKKLKKVLDKPRMTWYDIKVAPVRR